MDDHTNDEDMFEGIRGGDQAFMKRLYLKHRDSFYAYFFKKINTNRKEVVTDFYSEAFSILCDKVKRGKIQAPLKSSLKTLLIAIGGYILLRYYDGLKGNEEKSTDDLVKGQGECLDPDIEAYYDNKANKELIRHLLSKLGADCQRILRLSFLEENVDDAIMRKMNIPNTNGVRQKRFKCLKKLRDFLRKK